ncbi:MAG: hypothetical protein Q8Q33_01990 [Chlamydiota bacterium]|nr:hypothetical protein [Chlamydiota bacterium]
MNIKKKIFEWLCKDYFDDLSQNLKNNDIRINDLNKKMRSQHVYYEKRIKELNNRISSILMEIYLIIDKKNAELGSEVTERLDKQASILRIRLGEIENLYNEKK